MTAKNKIQIPLDDEHFTVLDRVKNVKMTNHKVPTTRQLKFVEVLFKTHSLKEAYEAAGYFSLEKYDRKHARYRTMHRVLNTKAVQFLIKIVLADWCKRNQVNAHTIAQKTLDAYNNATNIRDQLEALKLLAHLAGYQTPVDLDLPSLTR